MLTESQVYKEVDGHEDVKDDNGLTDDSDDYHDHAFEYVKNLVNGAIYKNENILLNCVTNSKKLRLISKNTQSIDDMSPHNDEDQSLIGSNEKQVVSLVSAGINKKNSKNATSDCVIKRDCEDLRVSKTKKSIHKWKINIEKMMNYSSEFQGRSCTQLW